MDCTLYNKQDLPSGRYDASVIAYNVENESLRSLRAQVTIFVGRDSCFVYFPQDQYPLTLITDTVISDEPVIEINATSTCEGGSGDIEYNITSQTYQNGKCRMSLIKPHL